VRRGWESNRVRPRHVDRRLSGLSAGDCVAIDSCLQDDSQLEQIAEHAPDLEERFG
jgi:hypothetical protein